MAAPDLLVDLSVVGHRHRVTAKCPARQGEAMARGEEYALRGADAAGGTTLRSLPPHLKYATLSPSVAEEERVRARCGAAPMCEAWLLLPAWASGGGPRGRVWAPTRGSRPGGCMTCHSLARKHTPKLPAPPAFHSWRYDSCLMHALTVASAAVRPRPRPSRPAARPRLALARAEDARPAHCRAARRDRAAPRAASAAHR